MPATAATKNKNHQTVEEQDKVARANHLRNQSRAEKNNRVGYIIHSPAWGTPLGQTLGKVILPIHRHNIITKKGKTLDDDGRTDDEFYTFDGTTLTGVDGEWFTTDEVVANYVRDYYGPMKYTVEEIRRGMHPSITESEAYLEAKAIQAGEEYDDYEDDAELVEVHPDTPRIQVE